MVNLAISKYVRILIIMIIFLFTPIIFNILLGQDGNGVIAHLEPKEINGDSFNGELSILISNNSKETVCFELEPFGCYSRTDTLIFYPINSSRGMCINELAFFKKGSTVAEVSVVLMITFLKFPPILSLEPGNSSLIKIQLDKENLHILKNLMWDVYFDIWYALKSDIDKELVNKPEKIIKEYNNSVFYRDTINIDLRFYKFSKPDTSLYISKSVRDYTDNVESIYDSVLKNFWHMPENK